MNKLFTILLVDDDERHLESLSSFVKHLDCEVFVANDGGAGYEIIQHNTVDLVLTDYRMPKMTGLELLNKIKGLNPDIDVVVMTAFGQVEDVVKIMKAGAYDYLQKPIDFDELENLIKRIREKRLLIAENRFLKQQLQERFKFEGIVSRSREMEEALNLAARVASSRTTILVRGESGTGKELITKAIHYSSPRRDKPLVVVNVPALSESILESELFGHERGAFTGANQLRIGRFEEAHGGTLFIDEVGDIPLPVQVKFLRAIQFGEIQRLGGNKTIKVDVRIIAATNRRLEEMIKNGEFREDLYYRLNVVTIWIPPLRQRKKDIPQLVNEFIKKFASENNKDIKGISGEALDQLMKYDFPGNVRELENIIERAVVLCRGEYLSQKDIPLRFNMLLEGKDILNPQNFVDGYKEKVRAFEKEMIREAIRETKGNKSAAARLLNITERHLRSRLEKLGLRE